MTMSSGHFDVGGGDGGRMGMFDGPDVFQHECRPQWFRGPLLLLLMRHRCLVGIIVARWRLDALLVVRLCGFVATRHVIGGNGDCGIATHVTIV